MWHITYCSLNVSNDHYIRFHNCNSIYLIYVPFISTVARQSGFRLLQVAYMCLITQDNKSCLDIFNIIMFTLGTKYMTMSGVTYYLRAWGC